jgi:imidazolonepropionase-like amidohydrolase
MSENVLAVKGGLLWNGTGLDPVPNGAVLVKGKQIVDAGPAKDVDIPREAKVIDARGKTIIPGLMDLHVHIFQMVGPLDYHERYLIPESLQLLYAVKHARVLLEAGFTTCRDLVYPFPEYTGRDAVSLRTALEQGLVKGCRLEVAGVVTSTASHLDVIRPHPLRYMHITADGVDEVRKMTRICVREQVDWIKTTTTGGMAGGPTNDPNYRNYTPEELDVIVDEAHSFGLKVASHTEGIVGCRMAAEAGIDTIEHASELDDDTIDMIIRKGLYTTPTLAPSYYRSEVMGLPTQYLPKKLGGRPFDERHLESQRAAIEAGVKMAMGSDCGHVFPPGANSWELEQYVTKLDMKPAEALLLATRNAADALGKLHRFGTLEKGKLADLLVVDGNPLENIRVLQDLNAIELVVKEGSVDVDRRGACAP